MDFRTFISELDKKELLKRVDYPVDWKFQIGKMTREASGALLFSNIKDYPGQAVLTGGLRNQSLIALSLGMDPGSERGYIIRTLRERLRAPIEPIVVSDPVPLMENRITGRDIDLLKFPVPWWSDIDGGRFIGTWHLNVTKDPLTGMRNAGVYRMQVLSPSTATVSVSPYSHLARHMQEAEKQSRSLEMAVCIGVSETAVMAAGAAFASDIDEFCMAGALAQKPLKLIRCETIDMEVPADSEIVVEGVLRAGERVKDGPYLDYAGIPSSNPRAYLFEVTSIMHRNNPVFRGTSVGIAGGEDHQLLALLAHLELVDFHGSRIRQKMQNLCLKNRFFSLFQMTGRIGKIIKI